MAKKATASLLDKVTVSEPGPKTSKNPVIDNLSDNDRNRIDRYREVQSQFKEIEAEKKTLADELYSLGSSIYASRACEGQLENFKLQGNEGSITFIVMKRFEKVSEEKRTAIVAAGLGDQIERDQIQLRDNISREIQERILKAVVKEFGEVEGLALFQTEYKVREDAIAQVSKSGEKAKVEAAMSLLKPQRQIRT